MGLKLVVSDMDGTLLQPDSSISKTTKEALLTLQKQGVRLVLASGRPKPRLLPFAKELEMDKYGGFLIESNGSAIYDFEKNKYDVIRKMKYAEVEKVFNAVKTRFPANEIYFLSDIIAYVYHPNHEKVSEYFHVYNPEASKNRKIVFIDSLEEIKYPVAKICLFNKPETIEKMAKELACLRTDYFVGIVMPFWIEINPIDMSKGNALQKIMDVLSLTKEEVIAFGDAENDVSMLEMVRGVAMGNAIASVKESCYYHTVKNTEEGVVKFLIENGYITQ